VVWLFLMVVVVVRVAVSSDLLIAVVAVDILALVGVDFLFATMVMHSLPSPGTMVIDAMGMVCFVVASGSAVASAPVVAPVPAMALVPIVAPVPAAVPGPVAPLFYRTMESRRDEQDEAKARGNIQDFHVMMDETLLDTTAFRNCEPSAAMVRRFVASRRRSTKQQCVRWTTLHGEYWPRMILRVKELEYKQSQAAKFKRRLDALKARRAAAKAKAKAKAKGKAKAKAAAA
jgi:hypothetical protein